MLNEHNSTVKGQILQALRTNSVPLGGEELGRITGVSRVAVHQHIRTLTEHAYPISSSRRGYVMGEETVDLLTPWEFAPEEAVVVLTEVGSTMDRARLLAEKHQKESFTVLAESQHTGYGRMKRSWISPPGGLWLTRVHRPAASTATAESMVLTAAAVLTELLRNDYHLAAWIEWPNDIMVDGLKIAGVLDEYSAVGGRLNWLALGLGVNVNNSSPLPGSASMGELTGRRVDRKRLLRSWTASLAEFEGKENDLSTWWNSLLGDRGKTAVYHTTLGTVRGTVLEIDAVGRLCLETTEGKIITLPPGNLIERKKNYA